MNDNSVRFRSRSFCMFVVLLGCAACGSDSAWSGAQSPGGASNQGDASASGGASAGGQAASGGDPSTSTGGETGAGGQDESSTMRQDAARQTAKGNALCKAAAPFYWEIGDASAKLVFGSVEATAGAAATYTESSVMAIASASKMLWGAYVVERFKTHLADVDFDSMTMRAGYSNFNNTGCELSLPATVSKCLSGGTKNMVSPDPATEGYFYYSGGDFQQYAADLGLGSDNNPALAAEYKMLLGMDLNITFGTPMPAGGIKMSAADYRVFLQKLLQGKLELEKHLGENAVCTLPPDSDAGGGCKAIYSPAAPYAWHYSYAHWVEDDPAIGDDGSFSSPGLFGFYPWVDAKKEHYGIVARHSTALRAYLESVQCGRLIRKAYLDGKPQ